MPNPDLDVDVLAGRMRRALDDLGIAPSTAAGRQPEGARG